MRLGDIMSDNVDVVGLDDPVDLAVELMRRQQIHHVVVIQGGKVVGIVSFGDVKGRRGAQRVREVMSGPVATATPHTTVRQAANLLRGRQIGCLPIVSDGELVGIVTASDLLNLIGSGGGRVSPPTPPREETHRRPRPERDVPGPEPERV
jgi:acetoin utilization protein AcuB